MSWWGKFELPEKQPKVWALGERIIAIMRARDEYCLWNIETDTANSDAIIVSDTLNPELLDNRCLTRHLHANPPAGILVRPRLADRSVVARPAATLRVPPFQEGRVLVSTPLWFHAITADDTNILADIPFRRPSDSWFGPSTRVGEICYAKYTDARLPHEVLQHRAHRAITPITIINRNKRALVIERINVPVPLLKLYSNDADQLWTQPLIITRESDKATVVKVRMAKKPPAATGKMIEVAPPRIASEKPILIRSITSLFA